MAIGKVPKDSSSRPIEVSTTKQKSFESSKGEMSGKRQVSLLSILKDVPNQGLINTIKSLIAFLFPGRPAASEDDSYVINVTKAELVSPERTKRVATEIFKPKENPNPNISKMYRIIDEIEAKGVMTKDQANHLTRIFESDNKDYTLEEIKRKLDHVVSRDFGGLAWQQPQLDLLANYWKQKKQ